MRSGQVCRHIAGVVVWSLGLVVFGCDSVDVSDLLPWPRHVIDSSSRGADGVRLADVNGDDLMDIATGWEEGGVIRVYLHPGHDSVKNRWPSVTVGRVRSPEDAVFADLDGDGAVDVVSSCEGDERTVYAHWAPDDPDRYLTALAWQTQANPTLQNEARWMFCLPMQIDGANGIDLVVGAKGDGAEVGWLEAPSDGRQLSQWRWHRLADVGWVMTLAAEDMDGDGDEDVVLTDRKGGNRGCYWLENPGPGVAQKLAWRRHRIGLLDREYMFARVADVDGDGLRDVVAATYTREVVWFRRTSADGLIWRGHAIELPESMGIGKGVAVGDVDSDGQQDIVVTCENAGDGKSGVRWLSYGTAPTDRRWQDHEISGPSGVKFDRVELIDLDGDGDLDVLTCEERDGLGVIWYENRLAGS